MTKNITLFPSEESMKTMQTNIDRLTTSVDTLDVMLKHTDLIVEDHQKEFKHIRDKIDQGNYYNLIRIDIIEVQSYFMKYATLEKTKGSR